MVNILISGAKGRMGKKVYDAAALNENISAVCGVDIVEDLSSKDYPVYNGFSKVKEKVDVVIDFSSPANLSFALKTLSPPCFAQLATRKNKLLL